MIPVMTIFSRDSIYKNIYPNEMHKQAVKHKRR